MKEADRNEGGRSNRVTRGKKKRKSKSVHRGTPRKCLASRTSEFPGSMRLGEVMVASLVEKRDVCDRKKRRRKRNRRGREKEEVGRLDSYYP